MNEQTKNYLFCRIWIWRKKKKSGVFRFDGLLVHKQNIAATTYKEIRLAQHKENIQCSKYTRFRSLPSLGNWEHLFSNMTAFNNMMFALRNKGIAADDLQTEVMYLAEKDILSNFFAGTRSFSFC